MRNPCPFHIPDRIQPFLAQPFWVQPFWGNQAGAALLYLISLILFMSVLGGAMVNLISTSSLGQVSVNQMERAYFMAEAGGHYALGLVKKDIELDGTYDDDVPIHNQTFILDDGGSFQEGRFQIQVDDTDPTFTQILVIAIIQGGVSTDVETRLTYRLTKTIVGGLVVLSNPVQYFSR